MAHEGAQVDMPPVLTPFVDGAGIISDSWWQLLFTLWQRTGQAAGDATFSAGFTLVWPGATADIPEGWLLCNGQAVSRTGYPNLFDAIGTTWGVGDGSTTFNVPNAEDVFLIGASALRPVGTSGGASTVTLATTNLPAHSHGVTDPGHTHAAPDARNFVVDGAGAEYANAGANEGLASAATTNTASATTGITTQNTGGGTAFDILPPFRSAHWIIKT